MESCDTCRRGSAKFLGDQWCEECREVLCKECEIAHSINKLTLDHHLTTYDPTKVPTAVSYAKSHELKVREDGSVECINTIMWFLTSGIVYLFTKFHRAIVHKICTSIIAC
jgi:hypothetical protein